MKPGKSKRKRSNVQLKTVIMTDCKVGIKLWGKLTQICQTLYLTFSPLYVSAKPFLLNFITTDRGIIIIKIFQKKTFSGHKMELEPFAKWWLSELTCLTFCKLNYKHFMTSSLVVVVLHLSLQYKLTIRYWKLKFWVKY